MLKIWSNLKKFVGKACNRFAHLVVALAIAQFLPTIQKTVGKELIPSD